MTKAIVTTDYGYLKKGTKVNVLGTDLILLRSLIEVENLVGWVPRNILLVDVSITQ